MMAEKVLCPGCRAELSSDAPFGLCPECLYQQAMEKPRNGRDDEVRRSPSQGFVPPTPAELARYFPQLEIIELLGQGGMGAVYKARQPKLDRLLAVKILPPEVARDPAFSERFTREARSLARLNHPNIVTIYDFGQADGLYYFTMEYVDGNNARDLLNTGKLPPPLALRIVPQVCDALQYAHDEGIVHRDIKPENILVDKKGRVKIADFGLARLVGLTPTYLTLTGSQEVMGTLYYMAPEQMNRSHHVDHRADLFSLGVVFYEMLTGEIPVGRFAPPSHKARVDSRLDPIVLRALAREPEERYQDAGQMKKDVDQVSSGVMDPGAAGARVFAQAPVRGNWPSVRFTIRHTSWWGGHVRGEIYRDDRNVILEFQADSVWGGRGETRETRIPIANIVAISCQTQSWPGMRDDWGVVIGAKIGHVKKGKRKPGSRWLPTEIVIKVSDPSLLADLPIGKAGRGRLRVEWGDQEAARELVESIVRPAGSYGESGRNDTAEMPRRPPDPKKIRLEVIPPAIGLVLTAAFAVVSSVGLAVVGLERLETVPWINRTEVALAALAVLPIATATGYLFVGALEMIRMRSYPFALAAGVLAVIPWSPAWILGLPFGIWALTILAKPEVREVFRSGLAQSAGPPAGGGIASFFKSFGGYFLPTFAGSRPRPSGPVLETKDHVPSRPSPPGEAGSDGIHAP